MDEELRKKIEEQDEKLLAIYQSVEKMRKYFLWTFWLTVAFFVLPLVALMFVIPVFLSSYLGTLGGGSANTEQMLEQVDTLQGFLR